MTDPLTAPRDADLSMDENDARWRLRDAATTYDPGTGTEWPRAHVASEQACWCGDRHDDEPRETADALIDDGGVISDTEARALWGDR